VAAPLGTSDRPDSREATAVSRESTLMRDVNRNMRHISETLGHSDPLMFFCECRSPSCHSPIWMSRATFDDLVATQAGWKLVDDHQPSVAWELRDTSVEQEMLLSSHMTPPVEATSPRARTWGLLAWFSRPGFGLRRSVAAAPGEPPVHLSDFAGVASRGVPAHARGNLGIVVGAAFDVEKS
jgi:hypothetical protein